MNKKTKSNHIINELRNIKDYNEKIISLIQWKSSIEGVYLLRTPSIGTMIQFLNL